MAFSLLSSLSFSFLYFLFEFGGWGVWGFVPLGLRCAALFAVRCRSLLFDSRMLFAAIRLSYFASNFSYRYRITPSHSKLQSSVGTLHSYSCHSALPQPAHLSLHLIAEIHGETNSSRPNFSTGGD